MNKDIIFIGGIEWHGKYKYSTHHIVERLLVNNRVFYMDNFGGRRDLQFADAARVLKKIGNVFMPGERPVRFAPGGTLSPVVVQSLLIPTPRFPKTVGRLNRFLLSRKLRNMIRRFEIHDPVIWNFVPTDVVWDCLSAINYNVLIYQAVDNFSQHPMIPEPVRRRFLRSERRFTQSADLVFANARNLYAEKIKLNSHTHFFPNGVHPDLFWAESPHIPSMQAIPGPIVGFAGLVGPWIDFDLLAECARQRPDWSFVMIGAISSGTSAQQLSHLPNVHFTGPVEHSSLGSYFRYFDVGIIPYRLTEFTRYTFPSKMAEYLAAGLPVISTALPEVEAYSPEVSIVRAPEQMIAAIERALDDAGNADRIESRRQLARSLSWDTIVGQMEKLIDEIARDKL